MSTLLLRLAAPLQSWGVNSKYDTRTTQREPTKSGVLGLLAAALGIRRDDYEALKELSKLNFGVRVDKEGNMMRDFHMVHGIKSDYVTYRYYLSDAIFLCGLESEDAKLLNDYNEALTHPKFPVFLGRRSCPPTLPLTLGIRNCSLETALENEPPLWGGGDSVRIVLDSENDEGVSAVCNDVPISFSPHRREFGFRRYQEKILNAKQQTEHDPFAEVEAENVSDKNGT